VLVLGMSTPNSGHGPQRVASGAVDAKTSDLALTIPRLRSRWSFVHRCPRDSKRESTRGQLLWAWA